MQTVLILFLFQFIEQELSMKRFLITFVCFTTLAFSGAAMALEVGDAAPDFTLSASDGKTYTLSQFKGQQAVVIAFFPKAFTGG